MKKLKLLFTILLLASSFSSSNAAIDSLRVMNWNILNFGGTDTSRVQYYRTVIASANPDIFVCQEINGYRANQVLFNQVFQVFAPGEYDTCTYIVSPDTGNLFFFKKSKAKFISNTPVRTELRDINEFKMYINFIQDTVRFYSVHLKASNGTDEELQRGREVDTLRYVTNQLPAGKYFIVMGDFNIYRSGEVAYPKLLTPKAGCEGEFYDPIVGMTGTWNNSTYRAYHTQSPRVRSFGGGATGGMDDRFDLILHSKAITNQLSKFFYTSGTGSYIAYGNDGNHFNDSINKQPNTAVSVAVANGIHYAADHIPVIARYTMNGVSAIVTQTSTLPSNFNLKQNYPNPFNPSTTVSFSLPFNSTVALNVYDLNGKEVMDVMNENKPAGTYSVVVDASALPSGTYFYRLRAGAFTSMKKMVLIK